MPALTNSIVIDAPAEAVWQVVAHRFDRMGDWATAIRSSTAQPVGESMVDAPVAGRVCHTGIRAVPHVTETIVAYDEDARTLTYQATDGLPAFISLARNRWQVTALDAGRSEVSFAAQLEVRGLRGRLARWLLLRQVGRSGRHVLEDLKHYVEHGTPSTRKRAHLGPASTPSDPVTAVGAWPTTRRLRAALRTNAVFCLVCGVTLLAAGWLVAGPWGFGQLWLPPAVGVGVAGFGFLTAWLAIQPTRRLRRDAALVLAADLAWVTGTAGLLAWHPLPQTGVVAGIAVAAAVAALAAGQLAGITAIRGNDPLADLEILQATRVLPAAPTQVWPLVTDHHLYGRLAPNLASVQVISDAGQPLRRRCTNTAGQHWEETCTLWDEGRRFSVDVDTSHYPYPIVRMSGLWQVAQHPAGSQVTIRLAYQPAPTLHGALYAIAVHAVGPRALARILDGWHHRLPNRDAAEAVHDGQ